jgi:hypothetical protein
MENKWYSIVYNSLLIAGIIIIFCTVGSNKPSSLTGTITGYSFFITGLFLLTGYLMKNLNSQSFISSLNTVSPFLILIGILIYVIYLLSYYFSEITKGNVSNGYYTFMNIFIVLLIVEMFVFYNGTQDINFKNTGTINKVTCMMLYLLELISIIAVISLGIILKYYTTDG